MSAFATLGELSEFLGISDLPPRSVGMLELASAAIRSWCSQTLSLVVDDQITVPASGADTLILPERPVEAVSSIEVDGVPFTAYASTSSGIVVRSSGTWDRPATVTYTHGHRAGSDAYQILKLVTLEIAGRAFTLNESSSSEALGPVVMETAGGSPEIFLTPGEKLLLAGFAAVPVG